MTLRRFLGRIRDALSSLIVHERIFIYRLLLPRQVDPRAPTLEPITDPNAIVRLYNDIGHTTTAATVTRRMSRHLDCFRGRKADRDVGLTWIQRSGARYIDELGLGIPLPPHAIWGRDAFVRSDQRGIGYFRQCTTLLHTLYPQATEIWSDVAADNSVSRAAHEAVGYEMRYIIAGWRIAGLLIIRTRVPPSDVQTTGFHPNRRVIFCGRKFNIYHEAHIT